MTREIKFRAWDKENKKMLEVVSLTTAEFDDCIVCFEDTSKPERIFYNLKDCVLMQFTGLSDKNGKEIYEGDIVKIEHWETTSHSHRKGMVFMRLGCWFVELQKELGYYPAHELEVIGNIHSNPELLEEKEK